MNLTGKLARKGHLTAYLIDPKWQGPFPYHLPMEQWPLVGVEFEKGNLITSLGQLYTHHNGFHFAFITGGTGTNSPTVSDRGLQNEVQRFRVDDLVIQPGKIQAFAEVPSDQGNITWNEWGCLMNDATPQLGTGTLYSRLLQTYSKNLGDSILLNYTVTETAQ